MTQSDMQRLIVDRVEGRLAVLEGDHGSMDVPMEWLPAGAGEGSILRIVVSQDGDESRVVLTLDREARAAREAEIERLRDSIPDGPDGDITL